MTLHEGKDLQFEVPDGWEDRSVVAYSAAASKANPSAPNVVVTRDKARDDDDPVKYANRQLGDLAKQLNGFRLQEQRDVVIGGLPGRALLFTWLSPRGRIAQRLTMIRLGSNVINVTTTVPNADAEKAAPVFDQILASMRFAASPPPSPKGGGGVPSNPPPAPTSSGGAATPSGTPSTAPIPVVASIPPPRVGSIWSNPGQWSGSTAKDSAPAPSTESARPSAGGSVPPPSLSSARSRGDTQVIGARAIADANGLARAAAAAAWQRPVEELVARDLYQYMPWACRHEVVYVTNNAEFGVVVASGSGEPLLFADPAHLAELNTFMRNENVTLPGGLPPNDLAQAIRTLLYGPEGYVGSPGFFQRERHRYELWMGKRGASAEKAFRAHCEGAVLNARPEGWALLFSCFSRQNGAERWEVTGKGSKIRTAAFTGEEKAPG
jgi:hypothetical protein